MRIEFAGYAERDLDMDLNPTGRSCAEPWELPELLPPDPPTQRHRLRPKLPHRRQAE